MLAAARRREGHAPPRPAARAPRRAVRRSARPLRRLRKAAALPPARDPPQPPPLVMAADRPRRGARRHDARDLRRDGVALPPAHALAGPGALPPPGRLEEQLPGPAVGVGVPAAARPGRAGADAQELRLRPRCVGPACCALVHACIVGIVVFGGCLFGALGFICFAFVCGGASN